MLFRSRATYESALVMAQGYNHELLKSDAMIIDEIERAIGEPLTCHGASRHLHDEKAGRQPAVPAE